MKLKETCIVINQRLCAPFLHLKLANETEIKIGDKREDANIKFNI